MPPAVGPFSRATRSEGRQKSFRSRAGGPGCDRAAALSQGRNRALREGSERRAGDPDGVMWRASSLAQRLSDAEYASNRPSPAMRAAPRSSVGSDLSTRRPSLFGVDSAHRLARHSAALKLSGRKRRRGVGRWPQQWGRFRLRNRRLGQSQETGFRPAGPTSLPSQRSKFRNSLE